ncbi:hypothetical protein HPB49_014415 [Dermacentor silvarum]|uniref:Uncharacterized protein n=1 Tax=Dermacentor silvarum TaxID=543639 RepID=A0ACB8D608_DERSI|nr:hypothetical protein HPB49_014415 [Dermacentor silvarum]
MTTSEFGNLPREILLVVGKPYMITSNIDVVDGLVNGAVGTLKLCERQAADDAYPNRLWQQFDVPTTGGITRARSKRAIQEATRKGAITVHKSQGGTYSEVVYEYAKTHPQKFAYVALSHCTNINNLYLTTSAGDHCFHHRHANADKNMADEFERLQKHKLDTVTHRPGRWTHQHPLAVTAVLAMVQLDNNHRETHLGQAKWRERSNRVHQCVRSPSLRTRPSRIRKNSGARTPTSIPAAAKRPHVQNSTDGV